MKPVSIALTGASGMPYAITLIKALLKTQSLIYVMVSRAAMVRLVNNKIKKQSLKTLKKPEIKQILF